MSVKYEGKSPSKLWYIWQNAKGLGKSVFNPATKKDARAAAKSGGISAGVLVGGGILTKIGIIAVLPLVPTVLTIAAVGGAGYYGVGAWRKFKVVKNSSAHSTYMRKQEQKWLDRKTRAPLMQRIKNRLVKAIDSTPRPLLMLGKWGGMAVAIAGVAALGTLALPAFSAGAVALAVTAAVAKAGAVAGLSATAATAAAITAGAVVTSAGVGVSALSNNAAYRTNPNRPHFGEHKFSNADLKTAPAPQKQLAAQAPSADKAFNDTAQKQPPKAVDGLSEERKKAAAERAAARKKGHGGQRFM